VKIVDRVYVTYTDNVTFTLVETWSASLEMMDGITETGEVALAGRTLTWHVTDAAPHTWYAITKTFNVLSGTWESDVITESLWVMEADPQLADRTLTFQHGTAFELFFYLPLLIRNR
jgi:hypothetical protein